MTFIPDDIDEKPPEIPWFEHASSELGIKGHGTKKSIEELQIEIKSAMSKLGGGVTAFFGGKFPGQRDRYGYEIRFGYGKREGLIRVAGLPMEHESPAKKIKTLKQALYTVRDALESQFNARLNMPGAAPLVGYLLDDKGRTLGEVLAKSDGIPLLTEPIKDVDKDKDKDEDMEIIEGEFVDD